MLMTPRAHRYSMSPAVNETIALPRTSAAAHEALEIPYTPYTPGVWPVSILLCGQKVGRVSSASFDRLSVIARGPDRDCSRAMGQGLTLRTVGVHASFSVSIRDCFEAHKEPTIAASVDRRGAGGVLGTRALKEQQALVFQVSDVGLGLRGRAIGGFAVEADEAGSLSAQRGPFFHHAPFVRVHLLSEEVSVGVAVGDYLVIGVKTVSGVYLTSIEFLTRVCIIMRYIAQPSVCVFMLGCHRRRHRV